VYNGLAYIILFINDISVGISEGNSIMLYTDDTEIWREINNESDFFYLPKDIDSLLEEIKKLDVFHPSECRVLSISKSKPPLIDILLCIEYFYETDVILLDYTDSEKYLGIMNNHESLSKFQ
jgi:hypothetical protein